KRGLRFRFHVVGPGKINGKIPAQHERMGEWLFQALPPIVAADIYPELVIHGSVAQQESISGGKQHSIAVIILPAWHIQRRQKALLDQGYIFLPGCGPIADEISIQGPAEVLSR